MHVACFVEGVPESWKSMVFSKTIFQAWKVMENNIGHGNDCTVMEFF